MSIQLAEDLLLQKFQQEPFHNLYLLQGVEPTTLVHGGTCSDKTLSYLSSAREAGLDAHLHSARIGGEEIHRLARLELGGRRFFADVGNGWPSIKLYSADTPTHYSSFGMEFRSEVDAGVIRIFHRKRSVEKLQMEIDTQPVPEEEMGLRIKRRFSSGITYPFQEELRFSMVVGERFLFLRHTQLEIYEDHRNHILTGISQENLPYITRTYFHYDLQPLLHHIQMVVAMTKATKRI